MSPQAAALARVLLLKDLAGLLGVLCIIAALVAAGGG